MVPGGSWRMLHFTIQLANWLLCLFACRLDVLFPFEVRWGVSVY